MNLAAGPDGTLYVVDMYRGVVQDLAFQTEYLQEYIKRNKLELPVGLGDKGGQFNQVYIDTFERVVLAGQPVRQVLDEQANALRQLMIDANAKCWLPDAPSEGPCPVE